MHQMLRLKTNTQSGRCPYQRGCRFRVTVILADIVQSLKRNPNFFTGRRAREVIAPVAAVDFIQFAAMAALMPTAIFPHGMRQRSRQHFVEKSDYVDLLPESILFQQSRRFRAAGFRSDMRLG